MELDGQQFDHYRILRQIGQGDIGEVYLAEDLRVRQQVALKIINLSTAQINQKAAARAVRLFLREVTSSSKLDHPNILPLYDLGEARLNDTQVVYVAMLYRPEGSLLNWLHQRLEGQPSRRLTSQQIIHIVRLAGAALQNAHDHRILHLNVKPANFLVHSRSTVDEYPDLLLGDFGSAPLINALSHSNSSGQFAPTYRAPEQENNQPGFASDLYALAVMAYELLTGNPPFQGTPESIIAAHRQEKPTPVSDILPLLPSDADQVLQRALEKQPEQRFPSVAAFSEAFQKALQGAPANVTVPVSRTITAVPATPDIPASDGDIRATLIISEQEAHEGTIRTLNLPNGSRINLQIPAETQAEEVVFLQGQGEQLTPDAVAGNLYITLLVQASSEQIPSELTDVTIPVRDFRPAQARKYPSVPTSLPVTPPSASVSQHNPDSVAEQHDLSHHISSEESLSMPAPIKPKRPRSPETMLAMLLLIFIGVGISAYSIISSRLPFLLNPDQTPTTVVSNPSPQTSATRPPTASSVWHPQTSGTTQQLVTLTWADTRYVAVGGPGVIVTSLDGKAWIPVSSGTNENLWSVAWSGNILVAVGTGGTILTSTDGQVWTKQKSGTTQDLWSIVFGDGSLFVVTGSSGTILSSRDGKTWTLQNAGTGQILDGITWSGTQYIIIGDNGTVYTSPDADTWTRQLSGSEQLLEAVFWAGTQFVVVGANGTILTSPDGKTWTVQDSGTTQDLDGVVWSASHFIAVGDNGTILTSFNGRAWTVQNSGTTQRLWSIINQGVQYVAVGNHGTILTSP